MSDSSVECMESQESSEAIVGENFSTEVQMAHLLHTDGWERGFVTDLSVRPRLEFVCIAFDEDVDVDANVTNSRLHGQVEKVAEFDEPPFVSFSDTELPYDTIKLSNIDESTFHVNSLEDLYRVGEYKYAIISMEKLDVDHSRTDGYLVAKVTYDIIGELSIDSNEGSGVQTIVLDEVDTLVGEPKYMSKSLESLPYRDEENAVDVKYKYEDDTLSVRHLPSDSYNFISDANLKRLFTVGGGCAAFGVLGGVVKFASDIVPSTFIGTVFLVGIFVTVACLLLFLLNRSFDVVNSALGEGEKYTHVLDGNDGNTSVWPSIETAIDIGSEVDEVLSKAKELQSVLKQQPREVTIKPIEKDKGYKLVAEERDVSWTVSDSGLISEDTVSFFVDYGFEEELDSIETEIVQDLTRVPDDATVLQSDCGDWYLLPEKIGVDPILTI